MAPAQLPTDVPVFAGRGDLIAHLDSLASQTPGAAGAVVMFRDLGDRYAEAETLAHLGAAHHAAVTPAPSAPDSGTTIRRSGALARILVLHAVGPPTSDGPADAPIHDAKPTSDIRSSTPASHSA
jgi:hypothetical protein